MQSTAPTGSLQPILIRGMRGGTIGRELAAIASANAYDVMIIGMIASDMPDEHALAIGAQYGGTHLHDGWYLPAADLLAYIQHVAQAALQDLLALVHPGAINEHVVDIEGVAAILGVSVSTVRRMLKDDPTFPRVRWGRVLRFVPADVIAHIRGAR